jgi:ATP-dependent RNA helicase RhlE
VLDEADRMLDMGFIHDVKRVIIKLPVKRQTLFFSATMPPEIQTLANVLLTHPSKVEVTPVSSTVDAIDQSLFFVDKSNKPGLLLYLLKNEKIVTALVFTRTKHGADKVVKMLHKENITAAAIHGNKSQNARQHALTSFKNGNLRVLVATDIAARGIDIDELTHVINFELPNVPETYVHRIGRTGRAGNTGIAFSFCDHEERTELKDIQKLIGKNIPVIDSHPYPLSAASFSTPIIKGAKPPNRNNRGNFNSSDRGKRRGTGPKPSNNR